MPTRRFHLHRSFPWTLLLLLFGSTRSNSFVEIGEGRLHAKMGLFFDETFSLTDVVGVRKTTWPWLMGIGWRADFFGHVGLVGSYGEVVEVRFREKRRIGMAPIPFRLLPCDRLSVRVEDTEGLVEALRKAVRA